jgi:ankyrin repeat protein
MVTILQKHGADIYQISFKGYTVLHIAAQADCPLLMVRVSRSQYYFLDKGLRIGVTDSNGNTPLHVACRSGAESAVRALIAWRSELDRKELASGMTPLHLAVISGNSHIVKKLLLKGCDRNIKDNNGKLALDIAR